MEEPEENLVCFKVNAKTLVSQAANGRARGSPSPKPLQFGPGSSELRLSQSKKGTSVDGWQVKEEEGEMGGNR